MKIWISKFVCLALLVTMVAACSDNNSGSSNNECPECTLVPSSAAAGLPGALGRFYVKPSDLGFEPPYEWLEGETTTWLDTDGVAPEVAGCHLETTDPPLTAAPRDFGELCNANGLLVETNPGVNQEHSHSNDLGRPDVFNCNTYCQGEYNVAGSCQPVVTTPTPEFPCELSAVCSCDR